LNDGDVFAKGGIMIGLFFFEFLVVLRTLEVFLDFDDVMILNEKKIVFKDYVLDTESIMV